MTVLPGAQTERRGEAGLVWVHLPADPHQPLSETSGCNCFL
jgi:hypothetical protein